MPVFVREDYTLFTLDSGRVSVACMAHARRNFMDVIKASKKSKRGVAQQAIKQIKLLYYIEREAQEKLLLDEVLLPLRKTRSIPILDKLKAYLLLVQPNIPSTVHYIKVKTEQDLEQLMPIHHSITCQKQNPQQHK